MQHITDNHGLIINGVRNGAALAKAFARTKTPYRIFWNSVKKEVRIVSAFSELDQTYKIVLPAYIKPITGYIESPLEQQEIIDIVYNHVVDEYAKMRG